MEKSAAKASDEVHRFLNTDVRKGEAPDENKYSLLSSIVGEIIDEDFAPLQKKRDLSHAARTGFFWSAGLASLKEFVSFGFNFLSVNLLNAASNYEFSPLDIGVQFTVLGIAASFGINYYNTIVYRDRFEVDGQKIKTINTGRGQIKFSVGTKGIAIEGEENTFLLHWDRVERVYPGLSEELQIELDQVASKDKFKKAMADREFNTYFNSIRAQFKDRILADSSVMPLRVRLYDRGEEKTDFKEELVIPKRFFRTNAGQSTWADFYLHCLGLMANHTSLIE